MSLRRYLPRPLRLPFRFFLLACALLAAPLATHANHTPPPISVAVVGNLQSELGCPGDWQPDCATTELNNLGDFWAATFLVPAGSWEYKVALNDSWDENYGLNGERNGPNLPLVLAQPTARSPSFTTRSPTRSATMPRWCSRTR
jgi:pullulanase